MERKENSVQNLGNTLDKHVAEVLFTPSAYRFVGSLGGDGVLYNPHKLYVIASRIGHVRTLICGHQSGDPLKIKFCCTS